MVQTLQTIEGIGVQGPVPALVARVRNMFIQEVWVKCPRDAGIINAVKKCIRDERQRITGIRGNNSLQILPDVDPVS